MFKKLRNLSLKQFIKFNLRYFIIALISIGAFIGMVYGYDYYSIKEIEVFTPQPINGLHFVEKQNLVLLDLKKVEQILYTRNPDIDKLTLEKIYPHTLRVSSIQKLKPMAYLSAGEGYFLLNEEGKIIAKFREKKTDFPIITYYQKFPFQNYQAGQRLSYKDISYSLIFLKKAQQLGLKINSIDIAGFHMLGLYTEDKAILFTTEKDKNNQLFQFDTIIRQFKIEGKEFKTLDLRFDKPIVTLEK
jgi:cell division septal protein FtsQ